VALARVIRAGDWRRGCYRANWLNTCLEKLVYFCGVKTKTKAIMNNKVNNMKNENSMKQNESNIMNKMNNMEQSKSNNMDSMNQSETHNVNPMNNMEEKTEINDNTLSFEDCLALAKDFLLTKDRESYYEFKFYNEDFGEEWHVLNQLTVEEFADVCALKLKYGDEFVKHLDEVFDDPDIIHDFTGGCEILDIDLDNVHHQYAFSVHELKPYMTVVSQPVEVSLSDEQYAELIAWHIFDKNFSINLLRYRNRQLFDEVTRGADAHFILDGECFIAEAPYVITLDEAKADAEAIIRQHNIVRSSWYRGI
jgi:hypothetical protein